MSEVLHIGEGKGEYQMPEKEKQDRLHTCLQFDPHYLRDFFTRKFVWVHILEDTNLVQKNRFG